MLLAGASAHALLIDFTSSDWNGVTDSNPYSRDVAGIGTVTLRGLGGSMTFNASDNAGCLAGGGAAAGLACDGDGIGIRDDEISSGSELLLVSFSPVVDVINIFFLDLFSNNREMERALIAGVDADGNPFWRTAAGTSVDVGGFVITALNRDGVSSLLFAANPWSRQSDFALAAIEVRPAAVTEPGTLGLIGLVLLSIVVFRWLIRLRSQRGAAAASA